MHELTELPIALETAEVLRFLGYPEGRGPAAGRAAWFEDLLAEARREIRGRGASVRRPFEAAPAVGLEPIPAAALVIGLATIGRELETLASARLAAGDAAGALILDAAGSAAVEEAAGRLGAVVAAAGRGAPVGGETGAAPGALLDGAAVGCRISPGYGRWRLEAQRALFARLPHAELGIALLPSLLMTPRKSVSFAMWLGADARPLTGLSGCARCPLPHCRYRRPTEGA